MKYMGSKSRIAKYIVPVLQDCINKNDVKFYVEPFVGGANVIDKIQCKNKYGYDINPYLIALHKRVQLGKPLYKNVSRELYNKARDCYNSGTNEFTDSQLGCIGLLASYNGRWFDGGYGAKFKNRDYYREAINNILEQSKQPLYKDILFANVDYSKTDFHNYVIYCDPPYKDVKQYGINKQFNHTKFWEWVREQSWDNYVFVSELEAPEDFQCIWEKPLKYSVGKNSEGKNNTQLEKLFVYKG